MVCLLLGKQETGATERNRATELFNLHERFIKEQIGEITFLGVWCGQREIRRQLNTETNTQTRYTDSRVDKTTERV